MPNITVAVPEIVYRRARVWAAERNTSVSQVVRYFLETLPGLKRAERAFPIPASPASTARRTPPESSSPASSV